MISKNFGTIKKTLKINSMRFVVCFLLIILASCSKSKIERNPYLGEVRFSYTINIDLPAYNALKYPQNTVYIPNIGIKGVFVTNLGNNRFVAWEAACPNRNPSNCERLKCASKSDDDFITCETDTKSYIFVICPCDGTVYNLVNGSIIKTSNSEQQYPLLNYNISVAGNSLTINN
ncbi:hypothetical protein CAPN001_15310 [Capnocytophaga stomatis]|uniref:hypothetical protein n=1 Tax=Capnocytophaga stomatis TaxID=1848904 RepID=UPI001A5AB193|nr:hypothetical protein [Capnocytophaga stomatis]GIJ96962.1 hypothetical protein CAPN001_15310 [Capnocytophaga stomatis]